ncbi:anti-sigma factor family protein [Actinacidiphila paucisporea]|uniref:Putative zinc-finger n=1 Tax=Actinacidiphila paucisporea TaxID=310782 RepID=A0A1M7CCU3_9ACTN|nr:zf-HC2 domain-containing protein [Actinacidiphila paucisporea]SHL65051.1 Putative zinc-finger [Actinacidiphila paucisporea]
MTSTTDQDPHPDVMAISDLMEGILPPERATVVRAHVESCVECAEVLASLREIQDLLGGMPEPEPMPVEVAARIDAALADEARLDGVLPYVPRETSLPSQDASGPRSVPRGTSASVGRSSASTGPGRRRLRRGLLIGAASVATVLALGGLVYELASSSGGNTMNADSGAQRKSGARNQDASSVVGDDVARLLGGARGGKTGSNGVTSPMLHADGDSRVTAPDGTVVTVPSCVLQATHRTQRPLAADREPYQGVDSFLVVLPDPADGDRVDAFVVTASCTADTPGRVLFHNSYPRS